MKKTIQVPRVAQVASRGDLDRLKEEREWERARRLLREDLARYGYGTATAKENWKRRITQTRSA